MLYFCYGSNMLLARLRSRCPSAQGRGTATLNSYSLVFHKRSVDGSGKCNIVATSNQTSCVYGTLADVPEAEQAALYRAEFVGAGYELQELKVASGQQYISARAFVAMPEFIDETLSPYCWYRDLVLQGALQHELPASYIAQIRAVAAIPDLDLDRAARHRSHLRSARSPEDRSTDSPGRSA
jgi:hypothetical protein